MRRKFSVPLLLCSFVALLLAFLWVQPTVAKTIDEELAEISRSLELLAIAEAPLKSELAELKTKMADLKKRIDRAANLIDQLEENIFAREVELGVQEELLHNRVRSYYKKSREYSPLLIFLASENAAQLTRELAFRQAATNQDKQIIIKISGELTQLKEDKERLEREKINLAKIKEEFGKRATFLEGELAKAEEYRAMLSSRQQQLLAEKLASLNLPTTLGAGPLYCTDDRNIDPGFRPAFAFYTFGIPHRVGMNQYGAYGRAQAGQAYQDILRTYFEGISFEKRPNININVQGYGSMPLEQYLLGIYEMPDNWPLEALKAQAVAARSYALAYTHDGANEICTTQKCQVYKGGNKGGNWEAAVRATEGEVAVHSGQVITAWYASTAGGYTYLSSDVGWNHKPWTKRMRDTSGDVGDFGDLLGKAYDRDSPCFYAAQGWRKEYGKSAWLKSEEVADIVNILMLAKVDPSAQKHLPQIDKPNPDGVETWNAERVKSELKNRGIIPYGRIDSVSVDWDKGLGRTTGVDVAGDAGSQSFDGNEFKDYFNLRSPANIQIVGPLYKVEKKG